MKKTVDYKKYSEVLAKEKVDNMANYLSCKNVLNKAITFISDIRSKLEKGTYNDPLDLIRFRYYLIDISYAAEKYNKPVTSLNLPKEYLNFDILTNQMSLSYFSTYIKNNGFFGIREYPIEKLIKDATLTLNKLLTLNKAGMYICLYPSLTKQVLYKEFVKHSKEYFKHIYRHRNKGN